MPAQPRFAIGAPRFELGTSSPPDWRANQAAPRPVRRIVAELAQPLVQTIDQIRHLLEAFGDPADADLAEVLRLDPERFSQLFDHVVRGYGAIAVHQVIEVAGRQSGPVRERAV